MSDRREDVVERALEEVDALHVRVTCLHARNYCGHAVEEGSQDRWRCRHSSCCVVSSRSIRWCPPWTALEAV